MFKKNYVCLRVSHLIPNGGVAFSQVPEVHHDPLFLCLGNVDCNTDWSGPQLNGIHKPIEAVQGRVRGQAHLAVPNQFGPVLRHNRKPVGPVDPCGVQSVVPWGAWCRAIWTLSRLLLLLLLLLYKVLLLLVKGGYTKRLVGIDI